MAPSPTRSKDRSRFYTGIAEAMADQWGKLDFIEDLWKLIIISAFKNKDSDRFVIYYNNRKNELYKKIN